MNKLLIILIVLLASCGDSKHITDPKIIHNSPHKTILVTPCNHCTVRSFRVVIYKNDTFYVCHRMFRKDALKPLPRNFKVWSK